MVKLDVFTDNVEWIHNKLAHMVENWINGQPKEKYDCHVSYGRRFIIESPDAILERYNKARTDGANNTNLDKLLDEYILSNYRNNPEMIEDMQKKRQVEPYVHQSIDQVSAIFGGQEAFKKVLFPKFWEQADTKKDVNTLITEFNSYIESNNQNFVTQIE